MAGRKQDIKNKKTVTVIFVEGDADELIINRLLNFYRENGWRCQDDLEVKNTNGFPSESKMKKKLAQIQQTHNKMQVEFNTLFCEYDTDIFEKGIQEKPNWKKVEDNLRRQYEISHFSRVRIIQRFGRIDRIGSQNEVIQLMNYWPDMTLDEYIDLKGRVEARMKVSVMTATGDDNPISVEEKGDLEYRRAQLKKLQEEVVDIEEMSTGISIMDLGLNEFRLDLLEYMKHEPDIEHTPFGLHAVVSATEDNPPGVVFVLKNRSDGVNIDHKNRLHPFYLVYVKEDGQIEVNHLSPKELLDGI